jgi:hypothetical protein
VTGTHAYARFGSYDVAVRVVDADNPANAATARGAARIADAPIHATGSSPTTAGAFSGTVATFTDDATPDGPAGDFSASIDWGDGSPRSSGTVSGPDASGSFGVEGSHAYAASGRYAATVVVTSAGSSTATATADVLVYAFATPDGGAFVISDAKAVLGGHVTFWGSGWLNANPFLNGVSYGGSFRGYADIPPSVPPPDCGKPWSGRTGGSVEPPASVAPYMAVLVTNGLEKSGPTIGGQVVKIVVVQTDPPVYGTYATGKVVADVCSMSAAPDGPPRR